MKNRAILNRKLLFATLLVFSFAFAQIPNIVMATNESASLTVNNIVPVLGAVTLTDSGDSPATTVDPEATYKVKFSVTDDNALDDLTNIVVDIYYGTEAADAIRGSYTFTWTEGAGSTLFVSSPAGYVMSSVTPTAAQELLSSFNFELHFKLDGVAVPSGATTAWTIKVTVTDDSAASDSDAATAFDVNKYQSISVDANTIAFGSVNPGALLTKQSVTVTFTANTELDVDVLGANLVSGAVSIAIGQFDAWDDSTTPTPTAHALTTAAQAIYSSYKATADAINSGVTGYTDNGNRLLGFDGDVPNPQQDGAYTATWAITLDQSAVTPT